ncbi:MAG: HEPN domain-containing protein [Clostridia bacterium]|nr:HEPN domain-containing protein [Clostridia bacterium]
MPDEVARNLSKYRLEKAKECLDSAKLTYDAGQFATAANRSYYAIFHSARAVLALDGIDRKKHSGVISYFQEHYIKTKVFDKQFSYIIKNAFMVRQESDYEDFYIISKEDLEEQIADAEKFVLEVEKYILSII